jgi:F-type H+-transporting ATPase subunit delta
MADSQVAHRYAKPLLELAIEQNTLDTVYQDMILLEKTCKENPEFAAVLKNPIIRGYRKMAILRKLFADKVSALTSSLFDVLARRDREYLLDDIAIAFVAQYNNIKNIQKVTLISATKLSEDLKKELKIKVENQLKKTIIMEEKIDASLIGGFMLKVGNDQVFDNSVRSQLQRLKMQFINAVQA